MTKQNTFEIYEKLRAGLMYPSIAYIPKDKILDYGDLEDIEALEKLIQPFDKIWICESLEINYPLKADTNLQLLLKKQDALKKNLFDLMDCKQNLELEQFAYLEKNYKDFLYVCMYFSQEMLAVLSESQEEHLTKYLKLFELQDSHYQKHFNNIEETFPTSEEEKKTWIVPEKQNTTVKEESAEFNENTIANTQKKAKKKKQNIITDAESQKYLLETVFHIKIDKS